MIVELIALLGVGTGLVGWFITKSYVFLFVGLAAHIIETISEWKNLNSGAKALDVIIFGIGCIVSIFTKTPFWVAGIVAVLIYSFLMSLLNIPIIISSFTRFK